MLSDIALIALAGLYLWVFVSQLSTPGFKRLQRAIRLSFMRPLIACPWCSGFWLSLVFTALLHIGRYDWVATPLTALAGAGLIGLLGSFTPGIIDEDEGE